MFFDKCTFLAYMEIVRVITLVEFQGLQYFYPILSSLFLFFIKTLKTKLFGLSSKQANKQNNNKNVKKAGNRIWQSVAVYFISL